MNFLPKSRFLHAILVKPVSNRRGDFTDVPDTLAKKNLGSFNYYSAGQATPRPGAERPLILCCNYIFFLR